MTLSIKGVEIECQPIYLTPETSRSVTTSTGVDARCIVCLEPCYRCWIDKENPPPPGCVVGHTREEHCVEHALPKAIHRGEIAELKKRGLIGPTTKKEGQG